MYFFSFCWFNEVTTRRLSSSIGSSVFSIASNLPLLVIVAPVSGCDSNRCETCFLWNAVRSSTKTNSGFNHNDNNRQYALKLQRKKKDGNWLNFGNITNFDEHFDVAVSRHVQFDRMSPNHFFAHTTNGKQCVKIEANDRWQLFLFHLYVHLVYMDSLSAHTHGQQKKVAARTSTSTHLILDSLWGHFYHSKRSDYFFSLNNSIVAYTYIH